MIFILFMIAEYLNNFCLNESGDRCDSLLDQCFGKPCGNRTCTNLSPEEEDNENKKYNITNHPGYVCLGCDPGFTYSDFKCQGYDLSLV